LSSERANEANMRVAPPLLPVKFTRTLSMNIKPSQIRHLVVHDEQLPMAPLPVSSQTPPAPRSKPSHLDSAFPQTPRQPFRPTGARALGVEQQSHANTRRGLFGQHVCEAPSHLIVSKEVAFETYLVPCIGNGVDHRRIEIVALGIEDGAWASPPVVSEGRQQSG
jgi:hypothetical protein